MVVTKELGSHSGKNYKSINEDYKEKERLGIGSQIVIISGKDKGLEGKILDIDGDANEINGDSILSVELAQSEV